MALQLLWRYVLRSPWYAIPVAIGAGLGTGANIAVVYAVNSAASTDAPYPALDRLVVVENRGPYRRPGRSDVLAGELSLPDYEDLHRNAAAFDAIGAVWSGSLGILGGIDRPRPVCRQYVTQGLLEALDVQASAGRLLAPSDFEGGSTVALLTHSAWQSHFGGDANVVGRLVSLDGRAVEVVGVLPAGAMSALEQPEGLFEAISPPKCLVLPITPRLAGEDGPVFAFIRNRRALPALKVVARLKASTSVQQADAQVHRLAVQLSKEHPEANAGRDLRATRLRSWRITDSTKAALGLVVAAGGLVFLAALANATGLLLTDGIRRRTELATRGALGASPLRLSTELMSRAASWALPGAAMAVGASLLGLHWFGILPRDVPQLPLLLAASSLPCIAAVALSAALALWPFVRRNLATAVSEYRSPNHQGLLRASAALQVAIAVALLFPTMLLNRSFTNLLSLDPGFNPTNALAVQLHFPSGDANSDHRSVLLNAIRDRLRTARGVMSAGLTTSAPLSRQSLLLTGVLELSPEGRLPPLALPTLNGHFVTPGYVDAMGLRLMLGRDLNDSATAREVLVDDTLARRIVSARVLGATLRWRDVTYAVVGVVRSTYDFPSTTASPTIYFPIQTAEELPWVFIVARAQGRANLVAQEVVRSIQAVDPAACLSDAVSLDTLLKERLRPRRRVLSLTLTTAVVALSLSCLSLYLALQTVVVARRREIAIRAALGAPLSARLLLVGRQLLGPLIAGCLLGGFAGYGVALLLASQLYEAGPAHAPGMAATLVVMCAVAGMAAVKPLVDAWRLDVAATLRES